MRKLDFRKYWYGFLHWSGWKATGRACMNFGKRFVSHPVWQVIFSITLPVLLLLSVFCGAALVWVFLNGFSQQVFAYFLYVLSAYCLCALCVKLPGAVRSTKRWLAQHPKFAALLKDEELQFKLKLYLEQIINFAYGIFKIGAGVVIGSAWIGCDGIYNFMQAIIQLFQILGRKKCGTIVKQWKSYRSCGVLILLLHLTLTGIVFQTVNWNRVEEQGEITIIATAAFAFYKFISSFIELAQDRKHTHPIDSSVRMLELSQALFAIFSLQAGLLHTFGTGESWEHGMNLATGCVVCFLTAAMGIYMIRRSNRELKKLQENKHG